MTAFEIESGKWAVESATGYIYGARFPDQASALTFIKERQQ